MCTVLHSNPRHSYEAQLPVITRYTLLPATRNRRKRSTLTSAK